jgi:hypothetical protein
MTTEQHAIILCDDAGELSITYEGMLTYHGRDFYGGVALAFKVLKLAFVKLLGNQIPHRNKIRLVVGFDPPGVIDALEYATRALTRRRLVLDPDPPQGPPSVFGRYYFEVHYQGRSISLWLKPDALPEAFTPLARKAFAGLATPEELAQWKAYKQDLGPAIMAAAPQDLLSFSLSGVAPGDQE